MPQGVLAVRNLVGATKHQSHRLTAIGAFDDICNRRARREHWVHPQTAFLLRAEEPFVHLLQEYLLWRAARRSTTTQLRLTTSTRARLFTAVGSGVDLKWNPGDLIALSGGTEPKRMADLFTQATRRAWGVHNEATTKTEKLISWYCGGTKFEDLCDAAKITRNALAEDRALLDGAVA